MLRRILVRVLGLILTLFTIAACDQVTSSTVININGVQYENGYQVGYVGYGSFYGYPHAGNCVWWNCAVQVIPVYDYRGYIVNFTFRDGGHVPHGYFREIRYHETGRYSYATGVVIVSGAHVDKPAGSAHGHNSLTGPRPTGTWPNGPRTESSVTTSFTASTA